MKSIIESIYDEDYDVAKQKITSADLSVIDIEGNTALHMAVLKKNKEIVNLLLDNACNANTQNKNGKAALHYAAESNLFEIAESLLKAKANLSVCDIYGNQPLWTAVFNAAGGDLNKFPIVKGF